MKKSDYAQAYIFCGVLAALLGLGTLGCNKNPEAQPQTSASASPTGSPTPDESELISAPGSLAVGGLPGESETENVASMTEIEANTAATEIATSTQAMSLKIAVNGANLTESNSNSNECKDGLFCLAKLFGMFYDVATEPAACNFKLLLKTPEGLDRPLRPITIAGKQFFIIDGFGTVGIGDQGSTVCPDHGEVYTWARQNRLLPSNGVPVPPRPNNDNRFFPPTRLVLYKRNDGNVAWTFVFFPRDFMADLARRVPQLNKILGSSLDFRSFSGVHKLGEVVGAGKGAVELNFDELRRMMSELRALDDQPQNSEQNDDSPQGIMQVTYDNSSPATGGFTVAFREGFRFANDAPFDISSSARILRSDNERYLAFFTTKPFGAPDPAKPEDNGLPVRHCTNPAFPSQQGEGPFKTTFYKNIDANDYLAGGKTLLQMIWKERGAGSLVPTDYMTRLTISRGGAFIYGPVGMETGSRAGTLFNGLRIKAPICPELTAQKIQEGTTLIRNHLQDQSYTFLDSDGFQNMIYVGQPGSSTPPKYASKATIQALMPEFQHFQFIDPLVSGTTPRK